MNGDTHSVHVNTFLEIDHDPRYTSLKVFPSAGKSRQLVLDLPTRGRHKDGEGTHVASKSSRFGTGGMVTVLVATDMLGVGDALLQWRGGVKRLRWVGAAAPR
jgi:hypothetical protein